MHVGKKLLFVLAAAIVATAAIMGSLATSGGKAASKATKVALVTDTGSLNDKGFNSLSALGLKRAEKTLGVQGRIYITQTAADRQPNLTSAAQAGYPLVFGVGVLFAFGPLPNVAPAFPTTMFAGIDVSQGDMCTPAPGQQPPAGCKNGTIANVHGIQFAEQEAGCLVGNVAALEMLREHRTTISAVGAIPVPAIVRYIAGYKYCAQRVSKKIRVLVNYANDSTFADQAKCKATALAQIARGSRVVFQVAGQCGLGALDAAKGRKVWGIGVDADQFFLGKFMLTSALKRVDQAVYDTIKKFNANPSSVKGGVDVLYSLKNGGVGYGRLSPLLPKAAAAAITKSTNNLEKQIIKGTVKPPKK
jgi:basic membrane protein A and related proteins